MQKRSATAAHCARETGSDSPEDRARPTPGVGEPPQVSPRATPDPITVLEATKARFAKPEVAKENPAPLLRARRGFITGPLHSAPPCQAERSGGRPFKRAGAANGCPLCGCLYERAHRG